MKKFLLFILSFICYQCLGQGNVLSITGSIPSQVTVCGAPKVFTVSLYNPSPFNVTNDTLRLTLPPGIVYQQGSVTGAGVSEFNTTNPNAPVFVLPAIVSQSPALVINYTVSANCDVIPYLNGGGVVENNIAVNYTANGLQGQDSHTTLTYTIKQPVLSITNVTNQTYSGSIGNIFTRCVTVTNNGLGELSQFTFTDVHGNGIVINNVVGGVWAHSGTTETVTFTGTHFAAIGNNNNVFEQGESITFCETVQINSCVNVASDFSAFWGCNNQNCQTATLGANVIFPNLIPNVEITPVSPDMNACMGPGNASLQKLMITNTGLGQATNIHLDIFQTNNGMGYNNSVGSWIDIPSLLLETTTSLSLVPDSTKPTSLLGCMPADAKGRMFLTIPSLNPGDTVYLSWNTYSCCYNACASTGQSYMNGWAYQGNYSNVCQGTYVISTSWGRVHSQLFTSLTNHFSPSVLDSGQTGQFRFLFNSFVFQQPYPNDTSGHWKIVFTIPPCLYSLGNPTITNGGNTWNPANVTTSGNTITAIFSETSPPFTLDQALVNINLAVNCVGCTNLFGNVDIKIIYVPSSSCNCEVNLSCASVPITILCSTTIYVTPEPPDSTCPHGMMFRYYSLDRTSYGLPDNEAGGGNGLPDIGGTLNHSLIKKNRAMFGDTITSIFYGKVRTSSLHPSFQYCYASAAISDGNLFGFLDSKLLIYRNGALVATCNNLNPTITNTGSERKFLYDLSAPALISSGCLPAGFVYSNGDSAVFTHRYKIIVNTTGPIVNSMSINEFYVSNVVNPGFPDRFQCGGYVGFCFIMGYKFETRDDTYHTVTSCQNTAITQNYYLSIGPCCSNYEGGNLFPNEYRNWAHINTLKAAVPAGYNFVSAQFTERRTAGSGSVDTCSAITLTPINPDSSTLEFPVEQYFSGYGGTIPLSDDGFSGTLEVIVAPSCATTPVMWHGITYDLKFTPTNYLTGAGSYPTTFTVTPDYIIYDGPSIFLQSALPSVNVNDSLAVWDITLSNTSIASQAENVWLSAPTISGVAITELFDVDNNTIIPITGNTFQLGIVGPTAVRNFQIKATLTTCTKDSIILYSGWNCSEGYPADVASYPCEPEKITLVETPLLPALEMIITSPADTVGLCDTTEYVVETFNFQEGTLYNVLLTAVLPVGLTIVPGSSQLLYPSDSVYVPITDPVFVSGTTWQWDISAINTLIGNNGLKGFLDSTLNSFQIKFRTVTNCNFTSGSGLRFRSGGNASCALPISREVVSEQLIIDGAAPVYTTDITMSTTYISPCSNNSSMHISIVNTGTVPVGNMDSISIILPSGVNYETGSFTGIHNAPANPTPSQLSLNNQITLGWKLPSGTQPGDSVVFNYSYSGSPEEISCGVTSFLATTKNIANVVCTSTGTPCDISVITGTDTLPVFIYKAYLSLSNVSAYSAPSPPTGETATISFTMNNTGQDILPANDVVISYYFDSNGNGTYNTGDVFISNDTLNATIPSNGNYVYTSNIFIPAGNACTIIASLDTLVNHCSCVGDEIAIDIPNIQISADTFLCSSQAIPLGVAPINGYTYLWSPATGLSDVNSSSPIYTAPAVSGSSDTVHFEVTTNRLGCTSTDTVRIITHPFPTLSVSGTDTLCFGDSSGIAIALVSGNGSPPYNYVWNTTPNQLNDTASGLFPGTYSVTVTDTNGCAVTDQFVINAPVSPVNANITAQTNLTCSSVCNGTATATASGGTSGYSYVWNSSPPQTTAAASGLCATSYSVTVTDASGCSDTDSTTITAPDAIVLTTATINGSCVSNSNAAAFVNASGGVPGYTYLWSNGQTTDTISNLSAGSFTVSVTDANNCTQTAIASITPAVNITASAVSNSICEGQSTIINSLVTNGTPLYSFLWNTAQTTQNITVSPVVATSYTLTITDANGCTDSTVVSITVRSSPQVNFISDSIGCSPLCISFMDTSTISAGTNQQWLWSFGDGSVSTSENPVHCFINNSAYSPVSNTVSLTVTSNEGCSATLSKNNYVTINPTPLANFSYSPNPATTLSPFLSFQNLSLGSGNWQWFFTNGIQDSITSLQHPYYTYTDTGSFLVTLIAGNGYACFDTIQKNIVIGPDWAIYIPNAFTPNDDGVNDTFFATTYGIVEFEMLIFDRWGNLIFQTDDIKKQWDGKANHGNEMAQMDIYVYTIKARDIFGKLHKYRGTITLVQ